MDKCNFITQVILEGFKLTLMDSVKANCSAGMQYSGNIPCVFTQLCQVQDI